MLSKYALVETLKNKTEVAVTRAMQTILIRARRTPQKLKTDAGKEFYNRTFQMKTHDIHHFSTHGDAKAAVAERFNRTLKEKLYRYLTAKHTQAYRFRRVSCTDATPPRIGALAQLQKTRRKGQPGDPDFQKISCPFSPPHDR